MEHRYQLRRLAVPTTPNRQSAFGGISGYIAITIWPTEEVLHRLEAIALHELHHNVRYSADGIVWDPQTVTAR